MSIPIETRAEPLRLAADQRELAWGERQEISFLFSTVEKEISDQSYLACGVIRRRRPGELRQMPARSRRDLEWTSAGSRKNLSWISAGSPLDLALGRLCQRTQLVARVALINIQFRLS